MIVFLIITLSVLVATYSYLNLTKTFGYWKARGVRGARPVPLLGTHGGNFFLRKSITELLVECYRSYPEERVVGGFRASRPELVIRDPALARRVLVADFSQLYARGLNPHKLAIEPLMRNLFFADGDLWRLLRQRMTPAFTSGKLKAMFPLIVERAERLQARALAAAAVGRALDARDLMARYTTDFIGAVGFGLDADSLNDDDSHFKRLGDEIFRSGLRDALVTALKVMFPKVFKDLKYLGRVERDVLELVSKILQRRNREPSARNDFIDLLLECRRKGPILCESLERFDSAGAPERVSLRLTDELLAAQVFVFFGAGLETSALSSSFTLHQLALHPEVQRRAREDVDRALRRRGGALSYDAVREMTYLEWTLKESLRMLPPLGFLVRQAARRYTFSDLNLTIDEGVRVTIPVQALQNDPRYFRNPTEFRPERFHPDEFDEAARRAYMPFGEGPRACIGTRMALMQSLAGLAALLSRFTVEPAPGTPRHPALDPKANIVQGIKGGLPLVFRIRTDAVAGHS